MQNLPTAEVYEKEFTYMPWGALINEVFEIIKKVPEHSRVLDLLCGPGYLLGKMKKIRPDLELMGVDLESDYIEFAKDKYPDITFIVADAAIWNTDEKFDLILVTAGVHHLPFEQQENFIKKVSQLIAENGQVIIADPYIGNYSNEQERKLASAKLGYEYLIETIQRGGGNDVIQAAVDVMTNDIFLVEYKNVVRDIEPVMKKYFSQVELHKTWPQEETDYGDYYFVLKQ